MALGCESAAPAPAAKTTVAADNDTASGLNDDLVAIRGPPKCFDEPVDEVPGEEFDGDDHPVACDWAA